MESFDGLACGPAQSRIPNPVVRNQTPANTVPYGLEDEVSLDRSVWTASSPRKLRFRQGYGLSLLTNEPGAIMHIEENTEHARQGYALEAAKIWFISHCVCAQSALGGLHVVQRNWVGAASEVGKRWIVGVQPIASGLP